MNFASLLSRELSKMVSIKNNSGNTMNLSSENSITPSSKRGWESMRVGRREFAWVFPQLSLVGETSSESWMRVDENLFSLSDYLVFSRCLHVSFSSLFDVCQTVDSPSHYSNCHLIFSFFLILLMVNDLEIPCFCNSLYDSRATLITSQTSKTSHWLSSKW